MDSTNKNLKISCLGSVYYGSNLEEVKLSIKSLLKGIEMPEEIILVIDGKIKKNLEFYLENLKKNKIIKLVYLQKNIGLGLALNMGLKECKYDLICRFDTDDISLSNRIVESKKAFINNPNLDIFGSQIIEFIDSRNKFVKCNFKKVPFSNSTIKRVLEFRNSINHPSVVFKRNSIIKLGGYENLLFFEDYHLWLKARKNNYQFKNCSIPLVMMRRESHSNRRTGFNYVQKEFKFYKVALEQSLLNIFSIIYIPFRLITRLLPANLDFIYYLIPWRNKYSYCLNPKYADLFSLDVIMKNK